MAGGVRGAGAAQGPKGKELRMHSARSWRPTRWRWRTRDTFFLLSEKIWFLRLEPESNRKNQDRNLSFPTSKKNRSVLHEKVSLDLICSLGNNIEYGSDAMTSKINTKRGDCCKRNCAVKCKPKFGHAEDSLNSEQFGSANLGS